jgi:hypothetical protein
MDLQFLKSGDLFGNARPEKLSGALVALLSVTVPGCAPNVTFNQSAAASIAAKN